MTVYVLGQGNAGTGFGVGLYVTYIIQDIARDGFYVSLQSNTILEFLWFFNFLDMSDFRARAKLLVDGVVRKAVELVVVSVSVCGALSGAWRF